MTFMMLNNVLLSLAGVAIVTVFYLLGALWMQVRQDDRISDRVEAALNNFLMELAARGDVERARIASLA